MASISATGYVHGMLDSDMDFPTFAMSCARAFGALVLMRDDPADATIPDEFLPEKYYLNSVKDARADLAAFEALDETGRLAWAEKEKAEQIASWREHEAEHQREVAKCKAMLAQVDAWQPPTEHHVDLKKFMQEQITQSVDREGDEPSFYAKEIDKLIAKNAALMIADRLDYLHRRVGQAEKSLAEELNRCADRTEWVKQLRFSLKSTAT
jgi:uncharacterized protein YllA (UPF0747 family)